jgi:hypothetical protein
MVRFRLIESRSSALFACAENRGLESEVDDYILSKMWEGTILRNYLAESVAEPTNAGLRLLGPIEFEAEPLKREFGLNLSFSDRLIESRCIQGQACYNSKVPFARGME